MVQSFSDPLDPRTKLVRMHASPDSIVRKAHDPTAERAMDSCLGFMLPSILSQLYVFHRTRYWYVLRIPAVYVRRTEHDDHTIYYD